MLDNARKKKLNGDLQKAFAQGSESGDFTTAMQMERKFKKEFGDQINETTEITIEEASETFGDSIDENEDFETRDVPSDVQTLLDQVSDQFGNDLPE